MKKKTSRSDKRHRKAVRNQKQMARRLASYAVAAGLGAFGCGEAARAAIVYTDVPDFTLNRGDPAVELNLDGDATGKLDLHFRNNAGGAWYASGRFIGLPYPGNPAPVSYSYALTRATDPPQSNPGYYVRAFHPNDQIGPVGEGITVKANRTPNTTQHGYGVLKTGLRNSYSPPDDNGDFGDMTSDQFAGIAIKDPSDGLHFGWVRLKAELLTVPSYPYYALQWTLYDWAYETQLNTPILAGAKPAPVAGDYNNNGTVDAADYVVWRDHLDQSLSLPNTDPTDTDDMVTLAEYNFWRSRFGSTTGSGSEAIQGSTPVPEPTSLALLAAGVGGSFRVGVVNRSRLRGVLSLMDRTYSNLLMRYGGRGQFVDSWHCLQKFQ